MPVHRHKSFIKEFKKLPKEIKEKFEHKLRMFIANPYLPSLNNHTLFGKWNGCCSINITGDYRAIYYIENGMAIFIHIGTHHQLYGK